MHLWLAIPRNFLYAFKKLIKPRIIFSGPFPSRIGIGITSSGIRPKVQRSSRRKLVVMELFRAGFPQIQGDVGKFSASAQIFNSFVRPSGLGQELFGVLWIWSLYHNIADHICDTVSTCESQLYLALVPALGIGQGIVGFKRSMRSQDESTHKSTIKVTGLKKDALNTSGNWLSKLRQVAIHGSSGIVNGAGPEAFYASGADPS
jgi:hypothetical protein